MTPAEMTVALGRVLKAAAEADAPRDDYRRGQLLSAYSCARHLAAEQSSADELRDWFGREMGDVLEAGTEPALGGHAARLRAAAGPAEIGEALCGLLGELRGARGRHDALHGEIRSLLRELADREVAALAHPPS